MGFVGGASVANLANTETGGASSVVASVTSTLGYGLGVAGRGVVDLYATAFSPLSLFSDGSQGVWYDDSNNDTLFLDAAGTTVTALESPVGLQLDLSQGLALGSELCTDTGFNNPGSWSSTSGWVVSGGVATGTATVGYLSQSIASVVAGNYYECTVTITTYGSGSLQFFAGNIGTARSLSMSAAGTYTLRVDANSTGTLGVVGTLFTGVIDNISFKQVLGNHRFQTTNANRPTLSARYNLLTKTEQFDNAVWTKANVTIVANAAVAPDGTTTADKIYPNTTGTNRFIYQALSLASGLYKWSFRAKAAEKTIAYIDFTGAGTTQAFFNLTTGAVGTVAAGYAATITSLGDGWYECSGTNNTASTYSFGGVYGVADANGSTTVTANGTDGIYIWGADLRPANQATGLIPTYQRVDTSSVYDTVGFPQYLKYTSNQWLQTASVNFTATAQMSAFSGVRKTSATEGIIAVLGTSLTSNGNFFLDEQSTAYQFSSKGTTQAGPTSAASYPSPETATLALLASISAPSIVGNRNGTQIVSSTATQGTGNYSNSPFYFGSNAGSTLYFNGYEFQTIIVGKTLTATEIANTETYVNSKTKAY